MVESQPTAEESKNESITLEGVVSLIESSIPDEIKKLTDEELVAKQKELSKLPYLSQEIFSELLYPRGENVGLNMVDTYHIVGSISPEFEDWSKQYDSRKGRHVAVAKQVINPTPESVEKTFKISEPWFESGIRLKQLSTPEGELYFVIDGSHRVAGCKLAELKQIPAYVEKVPEAKSISTTDGFLKYQWEERIKRGLITGNIVEGINESGEVIYSLNINTQVLPWMYLSNDKFVAMNKFYFEHFPQAEDVRSLLGNEPISREALVD